MQRGGIYIIGQLLNSQFFICTGMKCEISKVVIHHFMVHGSSFSIEVNTAMEPLQVSKRSSKFSKVRCDRVVPFLQ